MNNLNNKIHARDLLCPACKHNNRCGNKYCTNCGFEFGNGKEVTGPCLSILTSEQSSVVFPVKEGQTTIGRNIGNTIVINDEQVSHNHASIYFEDDKVWIEDLKSRNGVYLNGRQVTSRCLLHDGSLIRLGNTILRFEDNRDR